MFTKRQAKGKAWEQLSQPVDAHPNVIGPRHHADIGKAGGLQFVGKGAPGRVGGHAVMRQDVHAKGVLLAQHVGHAVDRTHVQVHVEIDDADLFVDDLEIPAHRVDRRAEIPAGMHQGIVIVGPRGNCALASQAVDHVRVDRSFHGGLETFLHGRREFAVDEEAEVFLLPVIPKPLPWRELVLDLLLERREVALIDGADRVRGTFERVGGISPPRKKYHAPIGLGLFLVRCFHGGLHQIPEVSSPAPFPCRFHHNAAVLRARDGPGENFLGPLGIIRLDDAPLG